MKQRRQSLHFDNRDEVLTASKSSKRKGTQQFETPVDVAAALAIALPLSRPVVLDLQCGHGALLQAAAITCPRQDTRLLLGVDIDPTACVRPVATKPPPARGVIHADCTKLLPLLIEAKATFDLIVCNPPFSLRWKISRWSDPQIAPISADGKQPKNLRSSAQSADQLVDSTLATFEAMHRLLSRKGEGMMICNADTAKRLLEPSPLWERTWLRLTMPNCFPGVLKDMQIAVVYFHAGHRGKAPVEVLVADALADTIRLALEPHAQNRRRLISAECVQRDFQSVAMQSEQRWDAAALEWRRLTDQEYAERAGWNIRLRDDGTIASYVTPIQTLSGKVPVELASALKGLDKQHPAALVVQRVSRKALVLAVKGGIWRVHSAVTVAVDAALAAYNAARAPLRPLNAVQRLGYLDEEDTIRCERCIEGFTDGREYPLETQTFEGNKIELRPHPRRADEKEEVRVTGQELLIRIKGDHGWHAFTQFPLSNEQRTQWPEHDFHLLSELVEAFHIPAVPSLAECHPAEFEEFKHQLRALEWA